ncbi:glycosyltransferase family 4 protein [Flavobacterium hercynium]|uniref:Glycosyl transferase n=1 Tax=Flavobacterium hercynium TaxID=387094 RepID=A0A226HD15_9FLAO|nr:glycosyltransferase [Flavobacterium hercynium]OXA92229.1 glycosyl transferase [Flavobacterium hercynium]SMP24103.1 Glycosyltransferase involved in cell wall bisynthesis [Flavobacterium hercynium]
MKFAIITHVVHIKDNNHYLGYAPYVREMNIWLKYVDDVIIVGPVEKKAPSTIDIAYEHDKVHFRKIPNISFTSIKNIFISLFKLPVILWQIFWAMKSADHVHLRCPGNIGLLGCFVQILFPSKIKTAKYAGNWDPKSKQPWTYKLQKYILNNTFLTRNMQVLVYGNWENQSKNVKSFFTATYSDDEKKSIEKSNYDVTEFIFVGSLVQGKNPLYAIQLVEGLIKKEKSVVLNIYGEGIEREALENYIEKNQLERFVFLQGNQTLETVKNAYQKSHFVVLPSKSEGWPKAVAEGMFWSCIPVATSVSCLPYMLDYGNRGILLTMNLEQDLRQIDEILINKDNLVAKSKLAKEWSQQYTTDVFESEIKKLVSK